MDRIEQAIDMLVENEPEQDVNQRVQAILQKIEAEGDAFQPVDDPAVRHAMGSVHAGLSEEQAIEAFTDKLKNGWDTLAKLSPERLDKVIRLVVSAHRENQALYHDVVRGNIG